MVCSFTYLSQIDQQTIKEREYWKALMSGLPVRLHYLEDEN